MNRDKRLKTIFRKNFIIYLLISILPSTLFLTVFAGYISYWNQQRVISINESIAESGMDMVDSIIREIEMFAVNLSNNTDVIAYIASDGNKDFANRCQVHLKAYSLISRYLEEAYVVNYNANEAIINNGVLSLHEQEKILNMKDQNWDQATHIEIFKKDNIYPYLLRIIRKVSLATNKGAVIIDINIEKLSGILQVKKDLQSNITFITTQDGSIIYSYSMKKHFGMPLTEIVSLQKEGIGTINDISYAVSRKESQYYNLSYISLMPFDQTSSIINTYRRLLIFSIISLMIISIISAIYVTKRSISPILVILSAIEQGGQNKILKVPLDIQYIVNDIIHKVKSYELSESELSIRLLLLKIAHVQALEAQINPHFLRNTLDSINWMAYRKMGKNNEISESIGKLSEMFWSGFQINEYIVPFSEELHHAQVYSDLLLFDEANKTEILFDVPTEMYSQNTVKFILQPIIENAIYHGIKPKRVGGKIWISTSAQEDFFVITVKDDGQGMDKESIDQLNYELKHGLNSVEEELRNIVISRCEVLQDKNVYENSQWFDWHGKGSGLGLKNVNNRIKLIFGEKYGLEIYENQPTGLIVVIKQPLK